MNATDREQGDDPSGVPDKASPEAQSAEMLADGQDAVAPLAGDTIADHARPARHFRTTALIIACALFMQNLDATVLATALPTMARDFDVPPTGISLALTSYLLALAIFIPASGSAADRFGGKHVFQVAIAVFVMGSVACALSTDLTTLVLARFFQGMGGAMMMPVGRLVLLRTVEKQNLVAAMAWLTMPAMIGPILGPPVGGLIVTYLDWRWIFWINLPIGLAGILLVGRFIEDVRGGERRPFDLTGFLLSGIGLGATMFALELLSHPGHGAVILPLLVVGLTGIAAYLLHARRTAQPIMDFRLLRVPTFRLSILGGTLMRITQGAQPFLLPMLMQLAFGLSAAASGAVTVAPAIGAFFMKGSARTLLRRFGFRATLSTVGVLVPLFYIVIGLFRPDWPWALVYAVLIGCGFLTSLQFTAFNAIAYDEIEPGRMSAATSFYSTFQQLAMSLGVCTAAGVLSAVSAARGHAIPQFDDFSIAIWSVAAISLTAIFVNLRFDKSAGSELAGKAR